jgi:MFS-type transporter involved in bile tolerance (Atg22 family)
MVSRLFGPYALSGSDTAFPDHGTVTLFTAALYSQRIGLGSTVILLCSGFVFMNRVRAVRIPDVS